MKNKVKKYLDKNMNILKNKWKEVHNNSNNNYNKDRKKI